MPEMDELVSDLAGELGLTGEGEVDAAEPPELELADDPATAAEAVPPDNAVEDEADAVSPPAAPAIQDAPKTWRAEAVALWKDLPDSVRAEVLKREEDMFRGLEGYKQQAEGSKALSDAVQPFMPDFQRFNVRPEEAVGRLLTTHKTLVEGTPLQKLDLFRRVATDYGVDLSALASPLPEGEDPRMAAMAQDLQRMNSALQQSLQTQATYATKQAENAVTAFASAVDQAGQPLHPYFDDLGGDMVALISSGAAKDLDDAYSKAIWQNPVTREKEIARMQAEKDAKAAEVAKAEAAARQKAEKARVRTQAKPVTAGAPLGSMDDTLQATLREIQTRTNG